MNINRMSTILKSDRVLIFVFALFLLSVGLFYSGELYLSHLSDGVADSVVADGVHHMLPGDHHEQFYRYSLFYENLIRGRLPYYTGYQYASADFTEGLIFFPFTAVVGLMSFVFDPILSYNLLLLSSYVFVGLAGFYMVRQITKSSAAGILAGVFLATVPFRTSFLYGQMVYGVDAVMLPLLIYTVERAKELHQGKSFFMIGLVMFLTLTANFQMFYWGMLLLSPYFFYVFIGYLKSSDDDPLVKLKPMALIIPGLLACLVYGLYIYSLIKGSALQGGQDIAETLFYTPEPHRLFIKFSGNEKNVYLGVTALFVMPWLVYPLMRYRQTVARSPYIPLFFCIFIVGMFLIFGPVIDRALKLPVYQWMFEHIPGFNGTRTPGRIMAVVVVAYAILLGFTVAAIAEILKVRFTKHIVSVFVIAVAFLIVFDFNYIKPGINTFAKENKVYRSISGKQTKVIPLPFQLNSAHYFNSTFLTYALRYDLRLMTGHSSFYPKAVDAQVESLFSLNDGFIEHTQWQWLNDNSYEYVVAHATQFEPTVSPTVIGALNISPYLDFVMSDNGVYLYKIRKVVDAQHSSGRQHINFDAWASAIEGMSSKQSNETTNIRHVYGWYSREEYADQKPFRWMKGVNSIFVLAAGAENNRTIIFDYFCPNHAPLKISVHRVGGEVRYEKLINNWTKVIVDLNDSAKRTAFVTLEAQRLFESPPDTRKFGCQVGDIEVR